MLSVKPLFFSMLSSSKPDTKPLPLTPALNMNYNNAPSNPAYAEDAGGSPESDAHPKSSRRTLSRIDSLLEMYAQFGFDEEVEEDGVYEDTTTQDDSEEEEEPLHALRGQAWDTRGSTGLYGGGGRGADDKETGWVRGYSIDVQRKPLEEDLFHGETQKWNGASGGGEQRWDFNHHNLNAPYPTPLSQSTFGTSYDHLADHLISPRNPNKKNPSLSASEPPHLSNPNHSPVRESAIKFPPRRPSAPAEVLPVFSDTLPEFFTTHTTSGHSLSFSTAASQSIKTPSSPQSQFSTQSKSFSSPPQTPIAFPAAPRAAPLSSSTLTSQPLPPPRPSEELTLPPSQPPSDLNKTKPTFKWSKSRKFPPISNPIIAPTFVASLNMETFDITPETIAKVSARTPVSPAKGPRPRKQLYTTTGAISSNPPEVVRTPMDALRVAGATTPGGSSDSDVADALHRLSKSSLRTNSAAPTPPLNPIANHQDFFKAMREERANPREVQANSPVINSSTKFPSFNIGDSRQYGSPRMADGFQFDSVKPAAHSRSESTVSAFAPFGSTSAFRDPWEGGSSRPSVSSSRPSVSSTKSDSSSQKAGRTMRINSKQMAHDLEHSQSQAPSRSGASSPVRNRGSQGSGVSVPGYTSPSEDAMHSSYSNRSSVDAPSSSAFNYDFPRSSTSSSRPPSGEVDWKHRSSGSKSSKRRPSPVEEDEDSPYGSFNLSSNYGSVESEYGSFPSDLNFAFNNYQITSALPTASQRAPNVIAIPPPQSPPTLGPPPMMRKPSISRARSQTNSLLEAVPELPETSASPPRSQPGGFGFGLSYGGVVKASEEIGGTMFRNPFHRG